MPDALDVALRERGLRATEQRRLVLDAVDSLQHGTVEEICARVRQQAPTVNLSTVYRALELLQELGLVTHAHLEHGSPTYHSTRSHEHLHLVCRGCGAVQEASPEPAHLLAEALLQGSGFVTDVRHLAVHGRCRQCARE